MIKASVSWYKRHLEKVIFPYIKLLGQFLFCFVFLHQPQTLFGCQTSCTLIFYYRGAIHSINPAALKTLTRAGQRGLTGQQSPKRKSA